MTKENEKLEIGKEYKLSNQGAVVYTGKDGNNGMDSFTPVKGNFSGGKIPMTPYQIRLRLQIKK